MPEQYRITPRADGRFVGTHQFNGTRRFVYGRTEAEVKRKLAELQRQTVIVGAVPTPGRRNVNDLLDAWLDASRATLKPKTLVGYEDTARWYIRPTLGSVKLARLEPSRVQALYANLTGLGHTRIPAQAHAVLHRACRLGVLWGWLVTNPCDRVLPPKYKAPRKKVWTVEQTVQFIAGVADDRYGPLFIFLALTGARLSEALALRWEDIDGDSLTIRRSVQRLRGAWVPTTPKTDAGERTLAIPASLEAALRAERARQSARRLRVGAEWCDEGLVFSTIRGKPLYKGCVAKALRTSCERLGLPLLTPHGLRHLSASLLLSENVPLPNVSQRLGHADPSITARIYSHVVRPDRRVADLLDELVAGAPGSSPPGAIP